MRRILFTALLLLLSFALTRPDRAEAQSVTVHVVQAGENLYRIALRYGVTVSALAAVNGLRDSDMIYVGQRLTIPGPVAGAPSTSTANGEHIVQAGETLYRIASRYGLTTQELAAANGIVNPNYIYVGQRLTIAAGRSSAPAPHPTAAGQTYTVQRGDTLSAIALRFGLSTWALAQANGIRNPSLIYIGQVLSIPGSAAPAPAPPPPLDFPSEERWIDVNLSTQQLTAYSWTTPVRTTLVSTGLPGTPTPTGQYRIYVKYLSTPMSGPGYYLPNVPYTMYFYRGYGLHGTYWHSNFGQPMSHGCVNLPTPEAEWLYYWAPVGTLVNIHY